MRRIDSSLKRGYLRELDSHLGKAMRPDDFGAFLETLAARYAEQEVFDPPALAAVVNDVSDIVASDGDAHLIARRSWGSRRARTGTLLRMWVDRENTEALGEATKYPVLSMRITASPRATQIFTGYVPFKITHHAVLRLLERSPDAGDPVSAGVKGMSSLARSLEEALVRMPILVAAAVTTGYPFFGIRAAGGILLCEFFEETTRYEASSYLVASEGVQGRMVTPIFGAPEPQVARVVLAKTWIGPSEIRRDQSEAMKNIDEAFAANAQVAAQFQTADLFRQPNWIDPTDFSYEAPPTEKIAGAVVAFVRAMADKSYRRAFPPPADRRT